MTIKKASPFSDFTIKEWITLLSFMAMMLGFLYARALLSIGMIVLFLVSLDPSALKENWQRWKKNRFAVLCVFFFGAYLLSGFWTEHRSLWQASVQTKLPFLVLPFALLNAPLKKIRFQKWAIYSILLILLSGICYSASFMFTHPEYMAQGLHLPSPVKKDYIRFTVAIVLGLQLVIYLFLEKQFVLKKTAKALLALWALLAILYLHIEAAKSGLVCFYALAGIYIAFKFYKRFGFKKSVLAVLAGLALACLAVFTIPPLKKQALGLKKEQTIWQQENTANFNKGTSVVMRLVSYQAAFILIKEHPLYGVGAGDLAPEMDKVYKNKFHYMDQPLVPHNQFLCTAVVLGIPMTLILLLMLLSPLRKNPDIYTVATFLIMLCAVSIGPFLEIQFGVFVYLFFTLFWMAAREPKRVST
jgi:hypothetical protein